MKREVEPRGFRAWWRAHRRRFGVAWAVTWVGLVGAAAIAGLDSVLRTGFQFLAGAVALPFAVALALALILVLPMLPFVVLSALSGGGGDISGGPAEDVAGGVITRYFGWIGRQRSPVFWGIPAGIVTAMILLAGIAYVRDDAAAKRNQEITERNREMAERNQEILTTLQALLARRYQEDGHLPEVLPEARDAYGQVLEYRVVEGRLKSSYTLTSPGHGCVDATLRRSKPSAAKWLANRLLHGREPAMLRCASRE